MARYSFLLVLVCFLFRANGQDSELELSLEQAQKLADLPLHCIETEYPNKLGQVLTDSSFLAGPQELHPIFYGCFDWHSSVHGHWLLAKFINQFPATDLAQQIESLFNKQFTAENVAIELAYFEPKLEKSFERTYGWAWLLKLQQELLSSPYESSKRWATNLQPLVDFIVESYKKFLPKLLYPIRVGEHSNTAFGLSLALDYARTARDLEFEALLTERAKTYYLADANCPLSWEPSGYDFISPCLEEAELMSKVLDLKSYQAWLKQFLPALFKKNFSLTPGKVLDRTDGKLVHLDGLNFSRARCLYSIAVMVPSRYHQLRKLGDEHVRASIEYVVGSDYMGSHWLASFLVYALDVRNRIYVVEIESKD